MIAVVYLIVAVAFKISGVSNWWQELLLGIPVWGWGVIVAVAMSPPWGFATAVGSHLGELESRIEELEDSRVDHDEDDDDG